MMRLGNINWVIRVNVVYGLLHNFLCIVSLYHAVLGVCSISNEGLQYGVESLVRIHLVKEHMVK
jgi:hypothetical protein